MIYISSSCIKGRTIKESVTTLAKAGFENIELSGGTQYYTKYEQDLFELKERYNLSFVVHNYFPPPNRPFVLNLASLNDDIYIQSIELCKDAIRLSKKFQGKQYGVHAGFLIDFNPDEAGKRIHYQHLSDRQKALKRFCDAWDILVDEANNNVSLYIENNVLSSSNATRYAGCNPFLLTDHEGYLELKEYMDFNLLLDVAHLKVSSGALGLDFNEELGNLIPKSDYIHLSENDGLHDQNRPLTKNSSLLRKCKDYHLRGKIITLEVYDQINNIATSYAVITDLIKSNKFVNTL
ncbi:sugar phosphate isomerase/epimerase [Acidobacteria bacterium AH-259-D05]|nr:sugar phosphate isomerase/epimerase [Acidobacteria bacterium AH-259-D05]